MPLPAEPFHCVSSLQHGLEPHRCVYREFLLHPCGLGKDLGLRELTLSGVSSGMIPRVHAPLQSTSVNLKALGECMREEGWDTVVGGGLHSDFSSPSGRHFKALPRVCVLWFLVVTMFWQPFISTGQCLGNCWWSPASENLAFFKWVSLGKQITLKARQHAQQQMIYRKQTQSVSLEPLCLITLLMLYQGLHHHHHHHIFLFYL